LRLAAKAGTKTSCKAKVNNTIAWLVEEDTEPGCAVE
jgi:hypothetical protein